MIPANFYPIIQNIEYKNPKFDKKVDEILKYLLEKALFIQSIFQYILRRQRQEINISTFLPHYI